VDAVQSTYQKFPNQFNVGEICNFQTATDGVQDGSMSAGVVIPVGCGVYASAADPNTVALPTDSATALRCVGVATRDNNAVASGTGGYPVGWLVNVLRRGEIAVLCETACNYGAQAYLRYTDNGAGKSIGQWRTDDDSSKAVAVPGAVFRTTTAGTGKIVKLEINRIGVAEV
jgi:hypothetical protein